MVENTEEKKKEEKILKTKDDVSNIFRRKEKGIKRSAFSVLSEDLGGILMDEPTQTISKEMLDEIKANKDLYINDTENPLKKLFIKIFANGKMESYLPQSDNYCFEVSIINAHPGDYTKIFEWNVIGKFALALENMLSILKSYSKTFNDIMDNYKAEHKQRCEATEDLEEKKQSQVEFLEKAFALNNKIATSLLEKNDFRCYIYGVYEDKDTGKITIKTNNKYLTMKTLKDKFMELDAKSGLYVTDYMLLKSGITTYKEYSEAWLRKTQLYEKWINENIGPETPDALIFHISLRYKEVLSNLSKSMGENSYFNEDGNIFFIAGDDSKYPVEIRVKMKLDKLFGGR